MKRLSKVLVLLLVLLALGGCHAFYGGTRDSGENRLEMEYSVLNTLDQEIFKLRAGDVVLLSTSPGPCGLPLSLWGANPFMRTWTPPPATLRWRWRNPAATGSRWRARMPRAA